MSISSLHATVVVGNPKPASRTSEVGSATATAIAAHAGAELSLQVVELAPLATKLFGWGDPDVGAAAQTVRDSDLLIVASPVYKASFTGLLKAFLDQFGQDDLGALATVPVMVGAGPAHSLAVEGQLRPVLVEIGASCPTRGLYVLDSSLDTLDDQLAAWLAVWGDAITAVAGLRARARG